MDPEAKRVIWEALDRNPEKEYAEEATRAEKIAREKRARERRLREERQNRWVIVQLAGLPEVRFDISNDTGRASLIRWYNNTFHPEPHETRSRTVGRTRSGRQVGVTVEKLPAFVEPAAKEVGKVIIGNVMYDLAKEKGKRLLRAEITKKIWATLEAPFDPFADQKAQLKEFDETKRDLFEEKLLFVPGTDKPRSRERQNELVRWKIRENQAKKQKEFEAALKGQAAWEAFQAEQDDSDSDSDSDSDDGGRRIQDHDPRYGRKARGRGGYMPDH